MIKVRTVVELPHLGLVVRAHRDGLDAWVRWAHVVEDFAAVPRLAGGELVVTTGGWRHAAADADRFICALAQRGVVAIAMTADPSEEAARTVVAACERWRVVFLEIPPGRTCEEASEVITTSIVNENAAALMSSVRRERSLVEALTAHGGVPPILDALRRESGVNAWLVTHVAVFAASGQRMPAAASVARVVEHLRANPGATSNVILPGGTEALVLPVRDHTRGSRVHGHLVCALASEEITGEQRAGIDQALDFLGAESAAQTAIRAQRRLCGEQLIRRAGAGNAAPEELAAWMRALQLTSLGHVVCMVVQVQHANVGELTELATALEDIADALQVKRIAAAGEGEAILFLFPSADGARETDEALARAKLIIGGRFGRLGTSIGTSSAIAKDAAALIAVLIDARQVSRLNALHEPEPVAPEVRSPPPLCALLLAHDDHARSALEEALIRPLLAYDAEHGSDLLHTLDVFLTSSGQWTASASKLGVHVNTLRYRLTRVEKITGRDLTSMADRVDFYIALCARNVAATSGPAVIDSWSITA